MVQSFTFEGTELSFGQCAEALSRSDEFTPAMAMAVLRSIGGDIAVAMEIDGQLWSQKTANEILQEFIQAKGIEGGLQLWAGLMRVDSGEVEDVPTILARPLIQEVLLEACGMLDEYKPPQSVTLQEPEEAPAFADIMKDAFDEPL